MHDDFFLMTLALQKEKIGTLEKNIRYLKINNQEMHSHINFLEKEADRFCTLSQINAVLDIIPVPCFILDSHSTVHYCNQKQAKEMQSDDPKVFMGRSLIDIASEYHWKPEMLDLIIQNNNRVLKTHQELVVRESMLVHNKLKLYESKKHIVSIQGKSDLVLGVSFDLTQHVTLEQDLERERNSYYLMQHFTEPEIFKNIIEKIPNFNLLIDIKGRKIAITEKQVICLLYIFQVGTAKKVAKAIGISHRTVEKHLSDLREKIGGETKFELLINIMASNFFDQLSCLIHDPQ